MLPFTLSHVSGFLLTVLSTTTGIGPRGVLGLTLIVATPVAFVLFGIVLIGATPVLVLALLYTVGLLLKVSNIFPISSLILLMFLLDCL